MNKMHFFNDLFGVGYLNFVYDLNYMKRCVSTVVLVWKCLIGPRDPLIVQVVW